MEVYFLEWLNILARWLHFITGIAWIGSSFYFVWLDNHLQAVNDPADDAKGVGGEVWSVHGGGFYHAQKYKVAPARLPETLHWFKWEAYTTWMSGMFLLALIYWYGAEVYLIDRNVAELSSRVAVGIAIAVLAGGWLGSELGTRRFATPVLRRVLAAVLVVAGFVVALRLRPSETDARNEAPVEAARAARVASPTPADGDTAIPAAVAIERERIEASEAPMDAPAATGGTLVVRVLGHDREPARGGLSVGKRDRPS